MDFNRVKVETDDGVATLTLNHPEVMNAISLDMLEGLIEAFDYIEDKANGVRCVVMTGAGKGFCAGANLQGRNTSASKKSNAGSVLESHYHPLLRRIRRLHCPILTAINGAAAGAGMSLSLMGDLKLASKSAYFLQAFRRIGLVPDAGSTYVLPRLVGTARAMELSLLGEKLPAEKALEWGLINRVYDDSALMNEAKKMASELGARADRVARAHSRSLLGQPGEHVRGAARPRVSHAKNRRLYRRFQGRRHGFPRKASGEIQGAVNAMDFARVKLDIDGGVALLTLNDPDVMNAAGEPMLDDILGALDHVEDRANGVRCLVMTGAGTAFCSGANLKDRGSGKAKPAGIVLETHWHPLLRRLRRLHCPIVVAVNGAAAGGGMSLALTGDIVIAARSAYFLQAFRRIALVPDVGSTWMLPRRVGLARAMELSLLGEKLPAVKALAWGLINRVVDDGQTLAEAMNVAREMAQAPTKALGLIRELYWDSTENDFEDQLDLEFRKQKVAGASEDFREGVAAFLEKRPANFKGR